MTSLEYLMLDDAALLAQCDVDVYKSSGPGGQHRNKVSSAVRLRHRPTGISAHGEDSRSQAENKDAAMRRLRMNLACALRGPVSTSEMPKMVADCLFTVRGGPLKGCRRLEVGRRDRRFWSVAAFLLDVFDHYEGRLSEAASHMGISTSNLASLLQSDRHLLAAAQGIRKAHGQKPIQ
jgi:hypothetical protein